MLGCMHVFLKVHESGDFTSFSNPDCRLVIVSARSLFFEIQAGSNRGLSDREFL